MPKGFYEIPYKPLKKESRFGRLGQYLYDESCYTSEELRLREVFIQLRKGSGIGEEYLETSLSWFNEDASSALMDIHKDSWFFSSAFKPKQPLSKDDFHIKLLDSARVKWPQLGVLSREIGDYLLIRVHFLPIAHYNQPLNYILIDVARIFRLLALQEEADHVIRQLKTIEAYLNKIEIHISPTSGSDRLFLADIRNTLERNIQKELSISLASKRLRSRLEDVKKQLLSLAEKRHALLHYAFSIKPVNEHPYFEYFIEDKKDSPRDLFPTLAVQDCAGVEADDSITVKNSDFFPRTKTITKNILQTCKGMHMVDSLSDTALKEYAQAFSDLQELVKYQKLTDEIIHFLEQAGEIITTQQLQEQMLEMFDAFERFTRRSHKNILSVFDANAHMYHTMIGHKQDLPWWQKLFGHQQQAIDNYIKNQDNLARIAVKPGDLEDSSNSLLNEISHVRHHISESYGIESNNELVEGARFTMQRLMGALHAVIYKEKELQGLPLPEKPTIQPQETSSEKQYQTRQETGRFFTQITDLPSPPLHIMGSQTRFCLPSETLELPSQQSCEENDFCPSKGSYEPPSSSASRIDSSFILFLPMGLIFLKYIIDWFASSQDNKLEGRDKNMEKNFNQQLNQLKFKIEKMENNALFLEDKYWLEELQYAFKPRLLEASELNDLIELKDDLDYFENSMRDGEAITL